MSKKQDNYKKATKWIAELLDKNNIKFHFIGGLAAHAYGSKIRYNDIDLAINLAGMKKLYLIAGAYVVERYWCGTSSNKIWKGYIMMLDYNGIKIDITEAQNTKIFNKKTGKYERFPTNINKPTIKKIFGLSVPVMPKKNLISYKSKLKFPNDIIDLKSI